MMWSDWSYSDFPKLGTYVQVQCFCRELSEGFVTEVDEAYGVVEITPGSPNHKPYTAVYRWRLRIDGEETEMKYQKKMKEDA